MTCRERSGGCHHWRFPRFAGRGTRITLRRIQHASSGFCARRKEWRRGQGGIPRSRQLAAIGVAHTPHIERRAKIVQER
jgi:hypothetical protein